MKNCSFACVSPCHQRIFCRKRGIKCVTADQKEILQLRTRVSTEDIQTICLHHEQSLIVLFTKHIKKCSNPFGKHLKTRTRSLQVITAKFYSKTKCIQGKVAPGEKLCLDCFMEAKRQSSMLSHDAASAPEGTRDKSDEEQSGPSGMPIAEKDSTSSTTSSDLEKEICTHDTNVALEVLGETPIKTGEEKLWSLKFVAMHFLCQFIHKSVICYAIKKITQFDNSEERLLNTSTFSFILFQAALHPSKNVNVHSLN